METLLTLFCVGNARQNIYSHPEQLIFPNILLSLAKPTDANLSYMALTVFSLQSWIVQIVNSTVERTTFFPLL